MTVDSIKSLFTHPEILRVSKFLVSGFLNTFVSYFIFTLFFLLGVPYLASSAIGYCLSACLSYFLNKKWTFNSRKSDSVTLAVQFCLVNLLALGLTLSLMYLIVQYLLIAPLVAQAITIIVTTIFNFFAYRTLFR
jgi:putative flippase GtrA